MIRKKKEREREVIKLFIVIIAEPLIIYRPPRNRSVTLAEANDDLVFYYIGATTGTGTIGGATIVDNFFSVTPDADTLSIELSDITVPESNSLIVQFFLRERSDLGALDDSRVDVTISFIGMAMI